MKFLYAGLLCLLVCSCNSQDKYSIPEKVENDWETDHVENVKMSLEKVNLLKEQINGEKYKDIHSLLIVKDKKLVFESYYKGYHKDKTHDIASVTKSITSALIGIAIDQGHIENASSSVASFYKGSVYEHKWDSLKRNIRIKDLLTMRHGLDCDDFDNKTSGDFNTFLRSSDYIDYMLNVKMIHEPDKVNAYCTGSTQLLEPVLKKSTNYSVENFASKFLFEPIGIKSFKWEKTPKGNPAMGMGADMTPRDMARFGQLYLNKGLWNGKRVISEDWIEESLTPYGKLFEFVDYGYMWYIEPTITVNNQQINYYNALGHGGQTIAVFPELNMVVVITAGNYNNESDYYDMLEKYLLPAIINE
ncbi:serine hydrolase domain-containing protein [Flavivirga algicola]|uniref:Serine hydrolase n=1 Tax=Flavivirga algicola TaxID=2729136 RepID=A0ABX1RSH5_9FLAO|nr:serine hydrolase [Flavivirga algicola]NMH86504.1 serine hydrolase [Flavivirga algicola]